MSVPMQQPKIKLTKQKLDQVLEVGTVLVLLAGGLILFSKYTLLPEQIPIHFDGKGNPDGHGSKSQLIVLFIIGILSAIFMYWINHYPHKFNYLTKITNENAKDKYSFGTRMIRILNLVCSLIYAFAILYIIQKAGLS